MIANLFSAVPASAPERHPVDAPAGACIHLVFGPQGAGKSTYARALAGRERAVRLAIDDWMSDLFTPDVTGLPDPGWMFERVARCERRLRATAADVLAAGTAVVLDIGGMRRSERDELARWARGTGCPARRHWLDAPHALREARVAARNAGRGPTFSFEVTPAMFAYMEHRFEPPAPEELAGAVVVDTAGGG